MATANTFTFPTLIRVIAGTLIPLWPISLPFCWFMAYRSYKNGAAPAGSLPHLKAAAELRDAGVLCGQEFEADEIKPLGKS